MNVGEIYRVYGSHVEGYADMAVVEIYDEFIRLKRLSDGKIVEAKKRFFESLPKRRLDEVGAYGNDCPGGACDV